MASLFFAFLLALLTAAFAIQNTASVTVRLLLWELESPLVIVILGSAALGAALAYVLSLGGRWQRAQQARALGSAVETQGARIRELEQQLRDARTPPSAQE